MIMNNIKRFLNLLNDETIEGKIIDCYCTLHKQAWNDGKIKTNIVLDLDGTITTTNEVKDNQLLIIALDEYVEVPEIEFGNIELQDAYQEFVDYLMEECEEIFESNIDKQQYIWDNATWSEYKYFNSCQERITRLRAWWLLSAAYRCLPPLKATPPPLSPASSRRTSVWAIS